jgi:hypothetical protein
MYGKPATTCLKYQMYLYGSEANTYLNDIQYFEWLQSQHYESSDCPQPPLQAAISPSEWQHNLTHL